MYFQVCSNSTYPHHSGEQYRTNGPLVSCVGNFRVFTVFPVIWEPDAVSNELKIL